MVANAFFTDRDRMQVEAFQSLNKRRRDGGMSAEGAFTSSIMDTSDKVMESILASNPNVIQKYRKQRKVLVQQRKAQKEREVDERRKLRVTRKKKG